jgi:dipeptidyl aminopeptidase/acylaminoacyl peptidase
VFAVGDDGGRVPVFRLDVPTDTTTRLTTEGTHAALSLLPDGTVVGIRSRLSHPPAAFRLDPAGPVLLAGSDFDGAAVAQVERFTVTSTDGAPVESFLLRPADHDGAPLPLVLWIHGGPISQFGDGWHWRWNPLELVSRGYAVAMANPRGSTGCGQPFIEGIWRNQWGGQCYADLMAVTDALAARPDVDGDRMAAMGGSFGGYMTNWIGANTDRFAALVTHASIFDLSAFYGVTDWPAWWALSQGTTPYESQQAFDRYSPHRGMGNWTTPTLVLHGEKDYRVPVSEGLALFEGLQLHGVPSELVIFPDENHWILKPRNIQSWYGTVGRFLDQHLV